MSRRRTRSALAALAALALAGCAASAAQHRDDAAAGYHANDIANQREVSLSDLGHGPVLLSSWATWCEECRTELPQLDALGQAYADRGLTVVAVNVNLSGPADDEIDEILAELDLRMPTWRDDQNLFARTFQVMGVPANVLLDANGDVVQVWNGAIDPTEQEVVDALETAFQRSAG